MYLPFDHKKRLEIILSQINAQEFSFADRELNALINATPADAQLWHLKSITTHALGKIQNSSFCINKALEVDPNYVPALINLAKLQHTNNWVPEAIDTYTKVLSFSPSDINALYSLGILLNKLGKFDQAEPYFESAFKINGVDGNISLAYGQCLLNQDKNKEALVLFNQILNEEPSHLAALNNKGIALKKLCYWKDAIAVLQKALKIKPDKIEVIKNLASCYTLSGDFNQSKSLYKKAVKLDNLDRDAHHWLNQLLWENKDDEFLNSYKEAITKHPQEANLLFDMGHKLNLSRDYEQAKDVLEKAIIINPAHGSSLIELGVVLRELNQLEESHIVIERAYNLDNNNLLAKSELGKSFITLDEGNKALKIFNELLLQSPQQQLLLAHKAVALKLIGSAEYDYLCNYEHVLITEINPPQGYKNLAEFNIELVNALRSYHHAKTNPLDQSLISGSQTSEKIFDYHMPIIQELRQSLREQTLAFLARLPKDDKHPLLSKNTGNYTETDSWSVILHNNGYHKNHHHSAGWYSGPYYAQVPNTIKNNPRKEGWVKLGQPGFNMMTQLEPDTYVQPTEGMMIRFPSYFWHGTVPFTSPQERITVPCDIIPI
jgi:tetratricopeptide (TPR) repeat protein